MICRILLLASFLFSFLNGNSQEQKLDYFLEQGIKNSPLIKDLNGQIQSNRIDSLIIRAQNKPRVELRGNAYYAPVINNFGYSEILTNISNLTTVMSVSQQIFNQKTVQANLLQSGIRKRSIANTIRITGNNLKKIIASAYLDVWSTYSEIAVNSEMLFFAKDQQQILKSLTTNGIYRQTDYLSFRIELEGQELHSRELDLQFRKEISDLYILCGIRDTGIFVPIKPELTESPPVKTENSPLFTRFYLDSLRINNEKILINRSYKPVVSWFSDAGLINNDPLVIYQNFGVSVGLNLTLPVYDGDQRKLNHRKLESEETGRAGYSSAFRREFDQQLSQLSDELDRTRKLIPAARFQSEDAKLLVSQEKELVSKGAGSITDYLIAVKNYMSVRMSLNQYEVRVLKIINEMNYLAQE